MDILAKRIKAARKLRGLSQDELADRLSVNVYSISKWETGARRPDATHLAEISMVLNIDVDYLLGVSDVPGKSSYVLTDEEIIKLYIEGRCHEILEKLDEYLCLNDEAREVVHNLIHDLYNLEKGRGNLSPQKFTVKVTPTEYGEEVLSEEAQSLC